MIFAERWRDPRLQKLAALALAMIMCMTVWEGLGQPLIDLAADDHPLLLKRRLIDEQQRLADRAPALREDLAALQQSGPDMAEFLSAATPSLAAAQMQDYVEGLVKPLGGRIASLEPLPFPDDEVFKRAGLRVRMSLRAESLPALLHRLEYGRPRLFLSDLAIKGHDGDLMVAADLFGYLPAGAP